MLLSDLAVHREQAGEQASYFDRHSAQSLADALADFTPLDAAARLARRDAARVQAQVRVSRFARDFIDLARAAATGGRAP